MAFESYAAQRAFILNAMDVAWDDLACKLTDPPVEKPQGPYGVMTAAISAVFGPGSNSVTRTYIWSISYVFTPDETITEPLDLLKIRKAGAMVDQLQQVNIGDYGYSVIAPVVHLVPAPEILASGQNAVTIVLQLNVDELHHV